MAVHYLSNRHEHAIPDRRDEMIARAIQTVWVVLAIVEGILLLRFGLRLLGANSAAPFSALVYDVSSILLQPFRYILPVSRIDRAVFEWGTLLAMFVYWLLAIAISRLILLARPTDRHVVVERTVDRNTSDTHIYR